MEEQEEIKLLSKVEPGKQESLHSEVELDPMEGEQTWPSAEELCQTELAGLFGEGTGHFREII